MLQRQRVLSFLLTTATNNLTHLKLRMCCTLWNRCWNSSDKHNSYKTLKVFICTQPLQCLLMDHLCWLGAGACGNGLTTLLLMVSLSSGTASCKMIYNSVWRVCLCILSSPSCVFGKNNRGDAEALAILFSDFTTSKAVAMPKQLPPSVRENSCACLGFKHLHT